MTAQQIMNTAMTAIIGSDESCGKNVRINDDIIPFSQK